jgi:hypothetical protein
VRGSTGFVLGLLTGVAATLLFVRLQQIRNEEEGIDLLTDRISDHLEELERRAAAAGQVVGEA